MKTILELLAETVEAGQLQTLVIGGHALPAFGVVRQTVDVDCLMSDAQLDQMREFLSTAGYAEKERTDAFVRYAHPAVDWMDVDVVLVDGETFKKMNEKSVIHRVGSFALRVPCLAHLLALKLHAMRNDPKREIKDMSDVIELIKANPGSIPMDEFQTICGQYGPEGIFHRLKGYI